MHVRTQLRTAIGTALASLVTPSNVYAERRRNLGVEDLPAVIFALGDDTPQADERAMGEPYVIERDTTLVVELHAYGSDGDVVSTTIDQMDLEVEEALEAAWQGWGILELLSVGDSSIEFSSEQENVLGVRTSNYTLTWRAELGSPDTPEG